MRKRQLAIIGAALGALVAVPTAAAAEDGSTNGLGSCEQQFDEAQRVDMESFRDFDRETWVAGHDDDAITIFTSGLIVQGRDNIGNIMAGHFNNREAIWTWTERTRAVDGCKTATIVYDATYAIPAKNFLLHQIVSVTYTYKNGKWLSVIDQGTQIPSA